MDTKTLLNDTPTNLVHKYYQTLIRAHVPIEQIILFGSYAKKKAKPWSDVDVCVVSKTFGKNPLEELLMLARLTTDIDTMIEPVPYHPDDLADKYDPLAKEIREHGIRIL
jgi:predicted nucleotidyltransferase